MKRVVVPVLLALLSPLSVHAAEDLNVTLERLVTGLASAFDSGAQLRAEQLSRTPKADQHVRVHRAFTRIDAPDVGDNVFVVTLRNDGPDGPIDFVEFQVWTLSIDSERNAVKMAPRRFKNPQAFADISYDADKMKGLRASDLVPSDGAASCPIYWQTKDDVIKGVTEKPCNGPIGKPPKMLSWDWTYILGETALWMSFAGRDPDTNAIIFGRQDQTPWRLDRVR